MTVKGTKEIKLGKLTLECKLDGRAILQVEKRLKKSILTLFIGPEGQVQFPPINEILVVLQGSNKTHGVSDEDIINAFEAYIDNGGTTTDLYTDVNDLLAQSGFFGKQKEDSKTATESAQTSLSLVDSEE